VASSPFAGADPGVVGSGASTSVRHGRLGGRVLVAESERGYAVLAAARSSAAST